MEFQGFWFGILRVPAPVNNNTFSKDVSYPHMFDVFCCEHVLNIVAELTKTNGRHSDGQNISKLRCACAYTHRSIVCQHNDHFNNSKKALETIETDNVKLFTDKLSGMYKPKENEVDLLDYGEEVDVFTKAQGIMRYLSGANEATHRLCVWAIMEYTQ